jgi:predicted ribosome quality control (RQC) complex YloA/Tae2 family protein
MQTFDYTTLVAVREEIVRDWLPSRIEQVYQRDRHTLYLALRTIKKRGWLAICWHPEAGRVCLSEAPPKIPDTFTFSDQLRHQLKGLALSAIAITAPWERVLDLQFAKRPGEEILWHLYVEIMGKYSNVILTDAQNQIIAPAKQISSNQSSIRSIQTGQSYEIPPPLTGTLPKLEETQESWQARVSLIPGKLERQLINAYRGVSPQIAREIMSKADVTTQQTTDTLLQKDWDNLYLAWQKWLKMLSYQEFSPGKTDPGYTILGFVENHPVADLQKLLDSYYVNYVDRQQFQQLHHQLWQKIDRLLQKSDRKAATFRNRLQESSAAENYRQQADLLMAHLHLIKPGMQSIELKDFTTEQPIKILLNPEKNAVQNAQALYKNHQKLKRAKDVVIPLLNEIEKEINYLQQVQTALAQLNNYYNTEDLAALIEIREELIEQAYLSSDRPTSKDREDSQPHQFKTPSGYQLLVGRNNRQNDRLTFRTANDYDLWFHTQEIPGSHVLLRLEPGNVAQENDLEFAANIAAYYSQAKESDVVPVIYTKPKHVYKPKGAKPGMAIYKQETVIWGKPQLVKAKENRE